MSVEDDRYGDVVFPEYYEDVFQEDDAEFRHRLIRTHIHPKLRVLLTGCLDTVAELFETDPMTFSRMRREPKNFGEGAKRPRCALYGLYPAEVRGKGFPNLRSSTGRTRKVAEFDLSFFADRDGLGLELHIMRPAELALLSEVYEAYRDQIDALLTFVRLGVDGPVTSRLVSLKGMIANVRALEDAWVAVFEPRYSFPIAARDFMGRFEDCFLALYLIYDAMLSRALGIDDKFEAQFESLENRYRQASKVDEEPPEFEL